MCSPGETTWGLIWGVLGMFWGCSGGVRGCFGGVLGCSWGVLRVFCGYLCILKPFFKFVLGLRYAVVASGQATASS